MYVLKATVKGFTAGLFLQNEMGLTIMAYTSITHII